MFMAFLPLRVTEPVMEALNPEMKKRRRVPGYDPKAYREIDWDEMETKKKTILLKKARDERKVSGKFTVVIDDKRTAETV
jgi:hypothetical protein